MNGSFDMIKKDDWLIRFTCGNYDFHNWSFQKTT